MNFLFVHQNFPGQFKHLAPALVAQGHNVVALGINPAPPIPGVRHLLYKPQAVAGAVTDRTPAALKEFYGKLVRGESAAQSLTQLAAQGFVPDVVFAHPGWGEALYIKDVFPKARLIVYAEYFYGADGGDAGFDPEFSRLTAQTLKSMRMKNTHLLHALHAADAALSPPNFNAANIRSGARRKYR